MIDAIMASLCVVSTIAGSSWVGGLLVFAPLHERTLLFKIQNRFRIADVIALGVLLQIPVGLVLSLMPADAAIEGRIVAAILISLVVLMWWVNGLRMLSRAGVENGPHRAAFLILVLPTGYLSVLLTIGTIILFPAAMEVLTNWRERTMGELALGWLFLVLPMIAVAWSIVCHRICRRMADKARDDQARRDGIEFDQLNEQQRDPKVSKYLVGRQRAPEDQRIRMEDPIVMATSAEPPEPVDGIQILDDSADTERGSDNE